MNSIKRMTSVWMMLLFPFAGAMAQEMIFERIYDESLSQASYLIGDRNERTAIVIDPKRDIDTYLEVAETNDLRISKVTETHIHADFLSGARELAEVTGAELLLSAEGGEAWRYEFQHTPLEDGSLIEVGGLLLLVMHTPGHTPESISFLVIDPSKSLEPKQAITGDFLFVGEVGRPDLLEKAAGEEGAALSGVQDMHQSLTRFAELPDELEIWPGHGAGSFCGKTLSNIPQSTLAEEKQQNPGFVLLQDREAFTAYMLDDQPVVPKYFAVMKEKNRIAERDLLIDIPQHKILDRTGLKEALAQGALVVDTRPKEDVVNGHIPGSLHIEGGRQFGTWMGMLVDYKTPLVLVAEKNKIEQLTRQLMRIGMDNVFGFITYLNEMDSELDTSSVIDQTTFIALKGTPTVQSFDVRTEAEYGAGRIRDVENLPLSELEDRLDEIDPNRPVVIHCQSGVRAAMAYSILKRHGFEHVLNYSGSMNEWKEAGNEVLQ